MKAIEAYNITSNSAQYFLTLYDGLINKRQRGMRTPWRQKFSRLARWTDSENIKRVDTKDALIVLRENSTLTPEYFSAIELQDLLRSSIVFLVSAIDRYVHERVIQKITTVISAENELNSKQKDLKIPLYLAMDIIKKVRTNKNKKIKMLTNNAGIDDGSVSQIRSTTEIKKHLRQELHKLTFQGYNEICSAFKMIGISNVDNHLRTELGFANSKEIRSKHNKIIARRNKIVHEGDIKRYFKGGSVTPMAMERKFVQDSLDWMDGLVAELEKI